MIKIFALLFLISSAAYGQAGPLTGLNSLATVTSDDLFYCVDDPAGTPASYKCQASTVSTYLESGFLLLDASNDPITGSFSIHVDSGVTQLFYVDNTKTTGTASEKATAVEIGSQGTGDRNIYIDLTGDDTYTSYGSRFQRVGGSNSRTRIRHRGTGDLNFNTVDAADISFDTSNTERMVIDSDGKVGVGVTSPEHLFHAASSSPSNVWHESPSAGFALEETDGSGNIFQALMNSDIVQLKLLGPGPTFTLLEKISLKSTGVALGSSDDVFVDTAGEVGIGTTSPAEDLHIYRTASNAAFRLQTTNSTGSDWIVRAQGSGQFQFRDNANSKIPFRLGYNADANLLNIGTNSGGSADDNDQVHVGGYLDVANDLTVVGNIIQTTASGTITYYGLLSTAPATCSIGDNYKDTSGANCHCSATNTWEAQGATGSCV